MLENLNYLIENESKPMTNEIGLNELLKLGYTLYYVGKNADLYIKPGETNILMVRTDRTSVNDVKLSDVIEGKSVLQKLISDIGFDFAEMLNIKTARLKIPEDIPSHIAKKSQYMKLAKPMTIVLEDGTIAGLELIYRKYLTGSLYKAYKNGEDPYGLNLPKGLKEWHEFEKPIFTPTTKGVSDEPLDYIFVTEEYPEEVERLQQLFEAAIEYCTNRGIILVDTKFEMFGDSLDLMLGDEVLTPESSRFIEKVNFDAGEYISMDKQILRDAAKKYGWTEGIIKGDTANITIPSEIKKEVIAGYQKIYDMLMICNKLHNLKSR